MRAIWNLLTGRGRFFVIAGVLVLAGGIVIGQRDVLRIGLLLLALPVIAGVLVARARLRMSCERSVEPARVPLGSPLLGRLTLGQQGLLPAGVLLLEDSVPRELGNQPRFVIDRVGAHWQRDIEYPLLGRVRGRFRTGPLRVRTTDPFGLVRLDRQFQASTEVMITPRIEALGVMRSGGGAGSAGEARPHRIGVVGQDDALVREYRSGDDVRRIHWRSSARLGQLMVRREEQAWDPSAAIVLDSRSSAHAGRGVQSSLEWAVSAAASVALHFIEDGYGVEIFEADGPMHIRGALGQHSSSSSELVVNRLTDLQARPTTTLHHAVQTAANERAGELVVAVLGRIGPKEANALLQLRRNRAVGLALVLDVDTFTATPADAETRRSRDLGIEILRDNQWRVLDVPRGMSVADAWAGLEKLGSAA